MIIKKMLKNSSAIGIQNRRVLMPLGATSNAFIVDKVNVAGAFLLYKYSASNKGITSNNKKNRGYAKIIDRGFSCFQGLQHRQRAPAMVYAYSQKPQLY